MYSTDLYQIKKLSISILLAGLASFLVLCSFRRRVNGPASIKSHLETSDDDLVDGKCDSDKNDCYEKESSHIPLNTEKYFGQGYNKDCNINSYSDSKKNLKDATDSAMLTSKIMIERSNSEPVHIHSTHQTPEKLILNTSFLHTKIEGIDRKGKSLFKDKSYMEAAEAYTEALELIERYGKASLNEHSTTFDRHFLTITNNRSAMYEKSGLPDLALHDCDAILAIDPSHIKARKRKLRIFESSSRYPEALVEVCALQLKFMKDNREKIRMGLPITPPVPQTKLEELIGYILPKETEIELVKAEMEYIEKEKPFPSNYTVSHLFQSFSGYTEWISAATKDKPLDFLTNKIRAFGKNKMDKEIELLFIRGRRYAYCKKFAKCKIDIYKALSLLQELSVTRGVTLNNHVHARIWEWAGMFRHLCHDLIGASRCLKRCLDLEPDNVEIFVKIAGVEMDCGRYENALSYFERALSFDPNATDALLYRANLFLQQKDPLKAKIQLLKCLELRPDFSIARLRLATVFMTTDEISEAQKCLDLAVSIDPYSSDVRSYLGEMFFSRGSFVDARKEFELAIKCDSQNPTAYFNTALMIMNSPPDRPGLPNISEAIDLLEKTLKVDPQFHQAYVHLGQLKLSMAMDLAGAKRVIPLYNEGLMYCHRSEEMKDILSMKILAIAQVEAANTLKMDTFSIH